VSTASYSTAITPAWSGYGGAELARLSDASGKPLSGTGGTGATATAFGLRLDRQGRTVLDTQPGSGRLHARVAAGGRRFNVISTAQTVAGAGVHVFVGHRFDADGITVRHLILDARGSRATLRFPAYGDAVFTTTTPSGSTVTVGTGTVAAGSALHVRLPDGRGYTVVFVAPLPSGAIVRVRAAGHARSAPRTRRTLAVEVAVRSPRLDVSYRLVPDAGPLSTGG
jgi:hypothetical protein